MKPGELRSDAAYGDQFLEQRFVGGRNETEEHQRVLADVGVDVQADLSANFGERGRRGDRDQDLISNSADINDEQVRVFL
jgi:hypothetical protein